LIKVHFYLVKAFDYTYTQNKYKINKGGMLYGKLGLPYLNLTEEKFRKILRTETI